MDKIQPVSSPEGIDIMPRDVDLLRGLFESRLMTLSHVTSLYFAGHAEAAKKRVQKLKAAGIVGERPRRAYAPSVLFLRKRAFDLLTKGGHLDTYPSLSWTNLEKRARVSDLTLTHEINVMDVKASFVAAVRSLARFTVAEFSTWPLLYQFQAAPGRGRDILVKPDGFIRVHEEEPGGATSEHTFFLEVDRSSEPQGTLAQRSACYRDYYRRGGLAARSGRPRSEYEQFPFRVLMVFRNEERRNNTAERLLNIQPPILSQVWLTTFGEMTTVPLGAIWITPREYREVIKDTTFAAKPSSGLYRRQPERELLVESTVTKSSLFKQ